MQKFIGYIYTMENTKTFEIKDFCLKNIKQNKDLVCKENNLIKEMWKVKNVKRWYSKENTLSRLTKKDLIALLKNLNDDDEVRIEVDYNLWNYTCGYQYEEKDGLCFDKETQTFRVWAGEFEC